MSLRLCRGDYFVEAARLRAERVGFEPTDPVSQVKSLAVTPIRPLSHLSVPICRQFPTDWKSWQNDELMVQARRESVQRLDSVGFMFAR